MASQAVTGAATGAIQGFAVGGPIGGIIGAGLGLIRGIFGDKSAKYKRAANKQEEAMVQLQQATQRRDIVRNLFLARSTAAAAAAGQESGGMQSSAAQGALSSIGSQGRFNLKFFDTLVERQNIMRYYLKKAGKYKGYSDQLGGVMQGLANLSLSTGFGKPGGAVTQAGGVTGIGGIGKVAGKGSQATNSAFTKGLSSIEIVS